MLDRPVVNIGSHAECEHVLALVHGLLVETAVFQTFFGKRSDRRYDDGPVLYLEFRHRVHRTESGFSDTVFIEGILVNEYESRALEPFCIGFQRCRVHGHQHVAEITRSSDMA